MTYELGVNNNKCYLQDLQPVGPDSLAVNSLCIASRDGTHWHRGEIVDVSIGGTIIKFIDVGDSDKIPLDKVSKVIHCWYS